ncbi:hypothetical protein GCM10009663_62720 [Kitasatospora arboriphila]|uniref:Tyr recombinase domain-containing protein n=1 Tax=Kitasatospora arboriphila TaxID=258052 RepID=A0ABN1U4P3_9ACTN
MVDAGAECGLRQGEIFGLAVDAVNLGSDTLHVVRQVKYLQGRLLFAPPKGCKLRDVPLPESVASSLRAHMERFAPVNVALPWLTADGPLVTHRLLFTLPTGVAVRRNYFNDEIWKEALEAAGVVAPRLSGQRPTAAREHGMHALRHFYASVLLDAGESIKAVSEYLGTRPPGSR